MIKAIFVRSLGAIFCLGVLASCSSVGTGERVLIKRCVPDRDIQKTFPAFTALCDQPQHHLALPLLETDGSAPMAPHRRKAGGNPTKADALEDFEQYLLQNYHVELGDEADSLVSLDVVIRDKNLVPAFQHEEANKLIRAAINSVQLNEKLTDKQRDKAVAKLEAKLINTPRIPSYTAISKRIYGTEVYDYHPRIEVDFSTRFAAVTEHDSFKHLGIVIKLVDQHARFQDFLPKEADILEFNRGQMAQASAVSLSPNISSVAGSTNTTNTLNAGDVITDSQGNSTNVTRGSGISLNYSETFTNNLVDALERRNSGIMDGGKTFFSIYKSTKNKRISGTYSYDLMLHIPSKPAFFVDSQYISNKDCTVPRLSILEISEFSFMESIPCSTKVRAEIYLLGVVRHVNKRGMTGTLNRAPEVENDDVFEQVVVQKLNDVLWEFDLDENEAWLAYPTREDKREVLTINSNLEEAQFGIFEKDDEGNFVLVKNAKGKSYQHKHAPGKDIRVHFYRVLAHSHGNFIEYRVDPNTVDVQRRKVIFGEYQKP